MLNAGLVSQSDGETTLLRRQGVQEPVCAVNSVGWEVLRRLDGRHTVQDISVALAKDVGLVHDGELEGKIACFVATLGKFGLLHQPYFVHIVEKYA
jgi:hypothetical protein